MPVALLSMLAAQVAAPPPPVAPPATGTIVVETLLDNLPRRPRPPPAVWTAPKPKQGVRVTNMEEVFKEENYPFWAKKNAVEGRVRFRVAVDAAGRPLGCEVTEPSSVQDLDQPTCDLLMDQARFAPALDKRGRPIPGIYSRVVRWQLENRKPHPIQNQSFRAIITVDAAGHRQCRIEASPGAEVDPRTCLAYLVEPGLTATVAQILLDRAGQRDRWELIFHEGVLLPGGPASEGAGIGEGPGEQLIDRGRFRLTIDAAGNVSACVPIERGRAPNSEWAKTCENARLGVFEAGEGERTVVAVGASYVRER